MVSEISIVITFDYKGALIIKGHEGTFWGEEYTSCHVCKNFIKLHTSH